jgi:hypothetical protein
MSEYTPEKFLAWARTQDPDSRTHYSHSEHCPLARYARFLKDGRDWGTITMEDRMADAIDLELSEEPRLYRHVVERFERIVKTGKWQSWMNRGKSI